MGVAVAALDKSALAYTSCVIGPDFGTLPTLTNTERDPHRPHALPSFV